MTALPEVCGPLRVIAYVDQVEEATFAPLSDERLALLIGDYCIPIYDKAPEPLTKQAFSQAFSKYLARLNECSTGATCSG